MVRKKAKTSVPKPKAPKAKAQHPGNAVSDDAVFAEGSGLNNLQDGEVNQPPNQKVDDPKQGKRVSSWRRTWLPAVLVLVLAVWFYQDKETQIQEVFSSVANTTIDEVMAKFHAAQLPAFNWTAALGLDAHQRVGVRMAEQGYKYKHPVAIVPGFVTSGLELWQGHQCAKKYFRQRMWGTLTMVQTFLNDKDCWFRHMMLDPVTGLDPEGIRLRSVEGFEAVDYFIQGYWVFNKLIEALADVGYTSSQLACMSYDWRMAAPGNEVRDGYFSLMRAKVELLHEREGQKVVLVAHSMGVITVRNFLAWVETHEAGWSEQHVHAFVNIAGASLGVPKAATALLSGELRDTTHLGALAYFLAENTIPRQLRANLWRTWGALVQMLPTGGEAIWGNSSWAPDDDGAIRAAGRSFGSMITAVPAGQEVISNDELDKNSSATQQADHFLATLRNWVATHSANELKPAYESLEHLSSDAVLKLLPTLLPPSFAAHAHNWAGQPDSVFPPPDNLPSFPTLYQDSRAGPSSTHCSSNHSSNSAMDEIHSSNSAMDEIHSSNSAMDEIHSSNSAMDEIHSSNSAMDEIHGSSGVGEIHGSSENTSIDPDVPTTNSTPSNADTSNGPSPTAAAASCGPSGAPRPAPASRPHGWFRTVDPVRHPLPSAPSMKLVCLYGVGIPTERGFHYLHYEEGGGGNGTDGAVRKEWRINKAMTDLPSGLDRGVQMSDGDGTVPLVSLGLMCNKGWRSQRLNPAGSRVVSREYKHSPEMVLLDPRGGPQVADHVSILGNDGVLADVIRVVTGQEDELQDATFSNIDVIAEQVDFENL